MPVTMNSQRLTELFDALDDEGTSPARRQAIEAELAVDSAGRRLLAARAVLADPAAPTPPVDLVPRVLGSLPDMPPRARRVLAEVIVDGWTDPALRAQLWRAPRAVLAARGLVFPEHTEVVAVSLSDAHLPRPDRVALPLPPVGGRSVTAVEARRQLGASDIGWLWGPPWTHDRAPVKADRAPRQRLLLRWVPAMAVAAAVVVVAWIGFAGSFGGSSEMSGAALDPGMGLATAVPGGVGGLASVAWPAWSLGAVVVVGALALVSAWLWWRRH